MGKKQKGEKLDLRRIGVSTDDPSCVRIPDALLLDGDVNDPAVRFYGILRIYCCGGKEDLRNSSKIITSQKQLAEDCRCCVKTVYNRLENLRRAKWITTYKRQWGTQIHVYTTKQTGKRKKQLKRAEKLLAERVSYQGNR